MKRIVYILIFVMLLVGCREKDANINNKAEKKEKTVEFNYEKTYDVIKVVLECEDVKVRNIIRSMERVKIKGAVSAEHIKEEDKDKDIIIEIESEDQKKYRVYMGTNYVVYAIKDMETKEYIHMVVE